MRSRTIVIILLPVMALAVTYFLGPKPATPAYRILLPEVPEQPKALEAYVSTQESKHKLKPDNNAIIVWNDSSKQKTEYAVVYLHGFSASRMEGDPVHQRFAKEFGCNLYLARFADHGIDTTEALLQFTPDRAWESAKQAMMIGKRLGHKVILMSTSTGGTLALKLAAEYPE
ncbi:MAG: alpha/beta hydrolase, partial [Chryseolinea sp.]